MCTNMSSVNECKRTLRWNCYFTTHVTFGYIDCFLKKTQKAAKNHTTKLLILV